MEMQGTTSKIPVMANEHEKHELRSLEFHRLVSEELKKDPRRVILFGLQNIDRWRKNGVDCADFEEWKRILEKQPASLPKVLLGKDERSIRLRQSSPFPGLIPEEIRLKILKAYP